MSRQDLMSPWTNVKIIWLLSGYLELNLIGHSRSRGAIFSLSTRGAAPSSPTLKPNLTKLTYPGYQLSPLRMAHLVVGKAFNATLTDGPGYRLSSKHQTSSPSHYERRSCWSYFHQFQFCFFYQFRWKPPA